MDQQLYFAYCPTTHALCIGTTHNLTERLAVLRYERKNKQIYYLLISPPEPQALEIEFRLHGLLRIRQYTHIDKWYHDLPQETALLWLQEAVRGTRRAPIKQHCGNIIATGQ